VRTTLADNLMSVLTPKVVLDCLLLGRTLDGSLQSVHEHVAELIHIHLLSDIGGVAIPVLECVTESLWIHVLLL
jgi:hypothetical protein